MDPLQLALVAALCVGAAVVVVGLRMRGGQRPIGSGDTPSVPPPAVAKARHAVVHIEGGSLAELLRQHADAAEAQGLRPFLEFGAVWCPPSRMFGDALEDPRMQDALAGVYLIRAELDAYGDDPLVRELGTRVVPVFYELAAEGRWTGRKIDGGAWGADTIENMSRTMAQFFAA